jgi:hypothetical protein
MQITPKELKIIAGNFSDFLRKQRINCTSELEDRMGTSLQIQGKVNDRIMFNTRPSKLGSFAYTISYIRKDEGIPMELKLNPNLNYTYVLIKCNTAIPNYNIFATDKFQNLIQNKVLIPCNYFNAKEEIINLAENLPDMAKIQTQIQKAAVPTAQETLTLEQIYENNAKSYTKKKARKIKGN